MKLLRLLLPLICLMSMTPSSAQALFLSDEGDKVSVELLTCYDEINPRQKLEVLIKFRLHDGWHIYAQNPGDLGLPTQVDWQLPDGAQATEAQWSPEEEFVNEGIVQYGYGDVAYYKTQITFPETVQGLQKFKVKISWLGCRDECIPGKTEFYFELPVSEQMQKHNATWNREFKLAKLRFDAEGGKSFLLILLAAFAGGVILNFMPCIFPILTIKAISMVQGRYNRRNKRIEALLYLAGVVLSFIVVATVLVLLRASGEQIGWGFQLQSPAFVAVMIAIFAVIFLMLLDVIKVTNPFANKLGRMSLQKARLNAFVTGFFAVLIASPCTAPFMGIAIGYTLTQPLYVYYPVFLALSLGYALPFTMIGFYPKVVYRMLPRPGKWMEVLKKIFAVPIFFTCVWLIWVLYNQTDSRSRVIDTMAWENYNAYRIENLKEQGEAVFIDFTAKWCITCLMNEKVALSSHQFGNLVKEYKIHLFKADWTNEDSAISEALEEYGRNSIPLYVFCPGKMQACQILPQILTPGILEDYIRGKTND